MPYLLKDCTGEIDDVILRTDLSGYVGKVITIDKYPGCFTVEYTATTSDETGNVESCFSSCEECTTPAYLLTDCQGRYTGIHSTDASLEEEIGNIIRIPYYGNACFTVSKVQYDRSTDYNPYIEYTGSYNNCIDCASQVHAEPLVQTGNCDPEIYTEIQCTFANMMYQQMMSRKLGIKFCCPLDKNKWTLKHEILMYQMLDEEDPELPEPYVEYCCIPIQPTCLDPNPCGCTDCVDCTEEVVEEVPCNCTASDDSPHDCHTYSVGVTAEVVALAVGNENTWLNNKVFFAYFKCKETKPTIIKYTEETAAIDICVLGIPVMGYYANDEWVEILTLVRGAVCEPDVTNTCCNG